MHELSAQHHLVEVTGEAGVERQLCRDLRTRSLNSSFGQIGLQLDRDGVVANSEWRG